MVIDARVRSVGLWHTVGAVGHGVVRRAVRGSGVEDRKEDNQEEEKNGKNDCIEDDTDEGEVVSLSCGFTTSCCTDGED